MFYVEPFIGYRAWTVSGSGSSLTSRVIANNDWPSDGPMKGVCVDTPFRVTKIGAPAIHDSPLAECTCGLHGWHSIDESLESYASASRAVVGAMVCWGRAVIHTKGFRVQYARPLAIVDHQTAMRPLTWLQMLEGVVERYSIPLIPMEDLQAYAETFGKPIGAEYFEE